MDEMVKLKEAMSAADQHEAAKMLEDLVGSDGKGGTAAVVTKFFKDNPPNLEPVVIPLEVETEVNGAPITVKANVKIDMNPIVQEFYAGALIAAMCAMAS